MEDPSIWEKLVELLPPELQPYAAVLVVGLAIAAAIAALFNPIFEFFGNLGSLFKRQAPSTGDATLDALLRLEGQGKLDRAERNELKRLLLDQLRHRMQITAPEKAIKVDDDARESFGAAIDDVLDREPPHEAARKLADLAIHPQQTIDQMIDKSMTASDFKNAGAISFMVNTEKSLASYLSADALEAGDGETLHKIVWLFNRLGRFEEAKRYAQRLAKHTDPHWRSRGLIDSGNISLSELDAVAAERLYSEALAVAESVGDSVRQIQALGNLGVVSAELGRLDAAETYQLRALALSEQIDRKESIAAALGNLGVIAGTRGDLNLALKYQQRSMEINQKLGRSEDVASALCAIAVVMEALGRKSEASSALEKCLEIHTSIGSLASENARIARENLARISRETKTF